MSTKFDSRKLGKFTSPGPEQENPALPECPPVPSKEHALDGSQYHNIIEEQVYAEQPPTAEEQKPWRVFHQHETQDTRTGDQGSPDAPAISVGTP